MLNEIKLMIQHLTCGQMLNDFSKRLFSETVCYNKNIRSLIPCHNTILCVDLGQVCTYSFYHNFD